MTSPDPHHLARFLDAQSTTYSQARAELANGQKRSHWMWFIFPQIAGLGSSPTAQRFAIASRDEALAYLTHPVLGPRLRECTALVIAAAPRPLDHILPYPDNLKFHSSLTLFAQVAACNNPENAVFTAALQTFFAGQPDPATLARL